MKIGNRNTKERVFIIAEIGNNHEGNIDTALSMVDAAANSGADAVKFQMINPEKLVSCDQTKRIEQLRKFCLTKEEFRLIYDRAIEKGVFFMVTPFYLEAVPFLDDLVPAFKVASSDIDFFPLLKAIALTGKPVIISCGIASKKDIIDTKRIFKDIWKENGVISDQAFLHCISKYPTMHNEARIRRIEKLKRVCETVGYSDHTIGIEACLAAVSLGAEIIEKHFTLDNAYSNFQDHKLSAKPSDFKKMVDRIRQLEVLLSGGLSLQVSDQSNTIIRRVAAASEDLESGQKIIKDLLIWVRPSENVGYNLSEENYLIGKVLKKKYKKGEVILHKDLN